MENKNRAADIVKLIGNLIQEFEASYTRANIVFMNQQNYDCIKTYFPYMLDHKELLYNKDRFKIIISQDNTVGLAYSYYVDSL